MNKIPVFYHIPKNAGTYVSNYAIGVFRYFRLYYTDWLRLSHKGETLKVLQIIDNGVIISRFLVGDPYFVCNELSGILTKRSEVEFDIDIKNVTKYLINRFYLFFVVIESNGFKSENKILKLIEDRKKIKFLILREPFNRAQSIYNYNRSNISLHDYDHGKIKSESFEEYISSEKMEDSWLIKNLLGINDEIVINQSHFDEVVYKLNDFKIYDIKDTELCLKDIFYECFRINIEDIESKFLGNLFKNSNEYSKFKLEDLSENSQKVFQAQAKWEQKLYDAFIVKKI